MNAGELSSRELLECYLDRVTSLNPRINAVVATNVSESRKRADEADAARKRGEAWGPLHGLPMTVKDTFEVVGMPCTAGAPMYKEHRPRTHASAVQRLMNAGAIVFGKTNVPELGSDLQSYNEVYGTTNNPWDTSRTPGGSSGGAAAALAAGFTSLELGSDIGGSIRTPSHYCGVFGHKVTHGIVSMRGHIPGPPGVVSEADLVVAGPMARSVEDLELALGVVAGPPEAHAQAWRIDLPKARLSNLREARVLAWFDDPLSPIDHEVRRGYDELVRQLRTEGAQVVEAAPLGMSLETFVKPYLNLLGSVLASSLPTPARAMMNALSRPYGNVGRHFRLPHLFDNFLRGAGQSHAAWLRENERRCRLRESLKRFLEDYDVILSPIVPTTAIAHLQSPKLPFRRMTINGEQRNYTDHLLWISVASLLGLPATAVPVGLTSQRLPYGLQVMGAPYDDLTTLRFAGLLEKMTGGFRIPHGWNA
jgi:amidase